MTRQALQISIVAALAATAAPAWAQGGKFRVTAPPGTPPGTPALPPVVVMPLTVPANLSATIDTVELSAGADTVLHIQDAKDPHGRYIGGNDDCVPGSGNRSSCVIVPSKPTAQALTVVVRSWNYESGGTGKLRVRLTGPGSSSSQTTPKFTFGVALVSLTRKSSLAAGLRISTVRVQKQATDTVLLVLQSTAKAVAFDDNDGAGYMSSLITPETSNGLAVVGSRSAVALGNPAVLTTPKGEVDLVWDEFITPDSDGDGLSDGFENTVSMTLNTTNTQRYGHPAGWDSDADGINDRDELLGLDVGPTGMPSLTDMLEYPTWGAKPLQPDVFVEADWVACNVATTPACNGNPDFYRLTDTIAEGVAAIFWGPTGAAALDLQDAHRIAVHMDIGVENMNAAGDPRLLVWGNWNGATRRPPPPLADQDDLACNSRSANRNLFHLMISHPWQGSSESPGWCAWATQDPRTVAHELGHNFFVGSHDGMPGAGMTNYKANYPSVMNYSYGGNPRVFFSNATFRGLPFNPVSVFEENWKGANTTADLTLLRDIGYLVGPDLKSVDWNQDGIITPNAAGPVRARVNWEGQGGRFRDDGFNRKTATGHYGIKDNTVDPTLSWYATPAENRLYLFYRDAGATGTIRYRHTTSVEATCSQSQLSVPAHPDDEACTVWAEGENDRTLPGMPITGQSVGVAEFRKGAAAPQLMVVYAEYNGTLHYQILTVGANKTESWSADKLLPLGDGISRGVAAVWDPEARRVDVYGETISFSNVLKRWSYNIDTDTWDRIAVPQTWSDGLSIVAGTGVGVTRGLVKSLGGTPATFAAIPNLDGQILFGRRGPLSSDVWFRLTSIPDTTDGQPGLGYVPMPDQSGRFYVLFRHSGGGWQSAHLAWTEGNDDAAAATKQRVAWRIGKYYLQEDGMVQGRASTLTFRSGIDSNLRGAFSHGANAVFFQPLADAIINFNTFSDMNDYDMMRMNVGTSFHSDLRVCNALNPNGTCSVWVK